MTPKHPQFIRPRDFRSRLVATLLAAVLAVAAPEAHAEPIRIGAVHNNAALQPQHGLSGILAMLVDLQNKAGGLLQQPLELISEDSDRSPDRLGYWAADLFDKRQVSILFGGWTVAERDVLNSVTAQRRKIALSAGPQTCVPSPPAMFCLGTPLLPKVYRAIDYFLAEKQVRNWLVVVTNTDAGKAMLLAVTRHLTDVRKVPASDVADALLPIDVSGAVNWDGIAAKLPVVPPPAEGKAAVLFLHPSGRVAPLHHALTRRMNGQHVPVITFHDTELDTKTMDPKALGSVFAVRSYFESIDTTPNKSFVDRWKQFEQSRSLPPVRVNEGMAAYATAFKLWTDAATAARSVAAHQMNQALVGSRTTDLTGHPAAIGSDHQLGFPIILAQLQNDGQFILRPLGSSNGIVGAPDTGPARSQTGNVGSAGTTSGQRVVAPILQGDLRQYLPPATSPESREALQQHFSSLPASRQQDMWRAICASGLATCQDNTSTPLSPAATEQVRRRVQLDALANDTAVRNIEEFTGLKIDPSDLKAIAAQPWNGQEPQRLKELRDMLDRKAPPSLADTLVALRRQAVQQTAPGAGIGGGSPSLPGPSGGQLSPSLPILPIPSLASNADHSRLSCVAASPAGEAIQPLPRQTFSTRRTESTQGSQIPYCRDGFLDILVLDTGVGDGTQRVCSGVRIAPGWALTARHCVKDWTDASGRIFQPTPQALACLETRDLSHGHPGDLCALPALAWTGIIKAPDKIDLALIRIGDHPEARHSAVLAVDATGPLELTIAGYGASPGSPPGRLSVGWTEIRDENVLRTMAGGGTQGDATGHQVRLVKRGRGGPLVSWICAGDSGSPLFGGRVFGWQNEPHNVVAINVKGTIGSGDGCQPLAPIDKDDMQFVLLQSPPVRQWLCEKTDSALAICR